MSDTVRDIFSHRIPEQPITAAREVPPVRFLAAPQPHIEPWVLDALADDGWDGGDAA